MRLADKSTLAAIDRALLLLAGLLNLSMGIIGPYSSMEEANAPLYAIQECEKKYRTY